MSENTFLLDGQRLPFNAGDTIMEAARRAGHYIPHLCYSPEFPPHGSCKLCSVMVNGKITSACYQQVTPDMEVESETETIRNYRRRLTQMLFVEGNHFCPICEKSGNCQLQAVAYYLDMEDVHYPSQFPVRQIDATHPDVMIDYDRCILCELCVRASRDIDHKTIFGIAGRGIAARLVVNSESGKLGDTNLSAEDRAANICPVGAIVDKHKAFAAPIGQRVYDRRGIDGVVREESGRIPE